MTELMHADIFFFISAIAVILVTTGLLIVLWYSVLILRDMRDIAGRAKNISGKIEEDFDSVRADIKRKVKTASSIPGVLLTFLTRLVPNSKKRRKDENPSQK